MWSKPADSSHGGFKYAPQMYNSVPYIFAGDRFTQARTALEYVERVRNSPCTGGTEETLPVDFDHSVWSHYAAVAMRMSNLLTKLVIQGMCGAMVVENMNRALD